MRILADENIPLLDAFFGDVGSIRRMPGRAIDRDAAAQADVLLVRSVTTVGPALLADSPVRFVGTCTIGTDHLDLQYLQERGVRWASAPGCNARGVVDYILGSLLTLAEESGVELSSRIYGVVGAGQVGGRLAQVLRGLGWTVKVCDPPRAAREGAEGFVGLDEILESCDVISLHTPLTRSEPWPSWHLLGAEQLARIKADAWLINASRGAVIDNVALLELLECEPQRKVVLDVWEGEPQVNVQLAQRCRLATPHIAGYSLDGKLRGTEQIYQAFCAEYGRPAALQLADLLPRNWLSEVYLDASADPHWALTTLCRAVYDPRRDDADFRRSLLGDEAQRRSGFDRLRKEYPMRRETDALQIHLNAASAPLQQLIRALGARVTIG